MDSERRSQLAIGGVIAVMALCTAIFCTRIAGAFGPMFADFGDVALLPVITRAMLSGWFPFAAAGLTATPAILLALRPKLRVIALVTSGALAIAIGAFTLWAAYSPIFEIAGSISSG